ncbi:MAG: MG2 domain-containing protein [Polyangiaceae bacterium]
MSPAFRSFWVSALLLCCARGENASKIRPEAPAPVHDQVTPPAPPVPPAEPAEPEAQPAAAASTRVEVEMPAGFVVLGPGREVPLHIVNVSTARLRLLPIALEEIPLVRAWLGVHRAEVDPLANLPKPLAARVKVVPVSADQKSFDVFASSQTGLVMAVLDAPGAWARAGLFQRGELSVLFKVGGESGLLWVTSTLDGQPQKGVDVSVRQGKSVRFQGRTDENGLLRLPAERVLRLPLVPGTTRGDATKSLDVIARHGKHVAFASETWSTGVDPWAFNLPESYYQGQDAVRGSVNSERGIYRPGESVHLLGVLRRRLATGKLSPPRGRVAVSVTDPDGNPVYTAQPELNEFGTFRSEFKVTSSARLGGYSVRVSKDGAMVMGSFEVGEYRPVRFEVKVGEPAGATKKEAEALTFPVTASYLYGSPLSKGKLNWTVSAREKNDFGEWAQGYQFGTPGVCEDYDCMMYGTQLVQLASGEAELDDNGHAPIEVAKSNLTHEAFQASQVLDLVVEASVQDSGGDVVVGRAAYTHSRTRALVGLATDVWVVQPKQGFPLKMLVASTDGKPRAGEKVTLRLFRRKWVGVAAEHSGERRYQGGWEDELVTTKEVVSKAAPSDLHFALSDGGEYRVEAALSGETASASAGVWAYGGDAYGAWENHARMKLRADCDSYRPGDRAKIYAENPYPSAWGLVTLEREGVLEARVMKLAGAGTPIEFDLDERRLPNVFASVAVVPTGLDHSGPAAGPPLRMGYQELVVSPEKRRLRVAIEPSKTKARPGDEVDVRVPA